MDKKFVIELDETTYCLDDRSLTIHKGFSEIEKVKFLVTDFHNSVSRVMHIEADIKYAEAMVIRRLQSEGEFDEPVSVITHWKRKRGKTTTEIFFTALPSRIYLKYIDKITEHPNLIIIFPIFGVLANTIRQLSENEPIAVVFRHDRYADLVIGKAGHFYYATKCVAFDTTEEQIQTLWDTVFKEIQYVAAENSITVSELFYLNWIDIAETIPAESSEFSAKEAQSIAVTTEQGSKTMSFPTALNAYPPLEGIAPNNGKLMYYSDRLAPFLMGAFVIAILLLTWGTLVFTAKTRAITPSILALEERIQSGAINILDMPQDIDHKESLVFVDKLFHNRHLPSYKTIVNDLSRGLFDSAVIELLDIRYEDRQVKIHAAGVINTDFDTAYRGYQKLLSRLQANGYTVVNNVFNTRIETSDFDLELLWSIQ